MVTSAGRHIRNRSEKNTLIERLAVERRRADLHSGSQRSNHVLVCTDHVFTLCIVRHFECKAPHALPVMRSRASLDPTHRFSNP